MNLNIDKGLRAFIFRLAMALAVIFFFALAARAGGPEYVAGSSYFNPGMMGQPLIWPQGAVNYYTDQGDLSPILSNASANTLVASSFAVWTSVSSAALTVTAAGQLSEDVNGSNIEVNANGVVIAPADITPSATQKPVGIVYDYDGSVTDALLGAGAGDASQCFWNAVFGGIDNFSTSANFLHGLVVINGQCALASTQLTDVQYRLVRVLGGILGLGWSQMNLNVITFDPPPTPDDYAGFPVMHYVDPTNCVPITVCYANPYQLAPDDVAALSRLYPLSGGSSTFARIYGSVYFTDEFGNAIQPMQGVNVVARWVDPSTGLPSDEYGASSVSGFLFTGNAGNPITGWDDPLGNAYSEFGSSNQSVEGFFDLGGLPIPNGGSSAQYELYVETLDPLWSAGVCPYDPTQVAPSGAFQPIIVTVGAGGETEQDILMSGNAQPVPPWSATQSWSSPAPVPTAGDWVGSLSGYGDNPYFLITAQANRTMSIAVTALDESSSPSESKTEPVIGIWTQGDPWGTPPPAYTTSPFNAPEPATSRLDAQILTTGSFLIGIADLRGDGRPDYRYHAHVLYGDSATPTRVPVSGGPVGLQGTGLAPGQTVTAGATSAALLASNATQLLVAAPAGTDGPQTVTITDPVSGAFSTMTDVLTYGAAATDKIVLVEGANPPAPVGTQATYPIIVQALQSDGVTPVNGATVGWSTTNAATLSACAALSACSVVSDESGMASTWVTPGATGTAIVTATLAPGVYSPSQSVSTTLSGTSSSLDIGVTNTYLWIAQGATLSVPLTARVLSLGVPQSGKTVSFTINQGSGSLSAPSAVTNNSGYATVSLTLTNFSGNFLINACVAPNNTPCQQIYGNAVTPAVMNLQSVAGAGQVVSGTAFQPLTVRVTDSSTPPNPVLGANVLFQSMLMRPTGDSLVPPGTDPTNNQTGMGVILGASQNTAQSDINGLVSFVPSVGSFSGPVLVQVQISAGTTATLQDQLESFPPN